MVTKLVDLELIQPNVTIATPRPLCYGASTMRARPFVVSSITCFPQCLSLHPQLKNPWICKSHLKFRFNSERAHHDLRRSGGTVSVTPSASPSVSRWRTSPTNDAPILTPDSVAHMSYEESYNSYHNGQSELMNALGNHHQNGSHDVHYNSQFYSHLPSPYHPIISASLPLLKFVGLRWL